MLDVTDEELLASVLEGDASRFGELFDRHKDRVLRQMQRRVSNWADAEDLVAVAFLEAWNKRGSLRFVDGSVLPWLLVTANNLANNQQRAFRRYQNFVARLPAPPSEPDHAETILELMAQEERRSGLENAFHLLSSRDQEILLLCIIEELPITDSAKALGITAGSARTRLSRARKKLAVILADTEAIAIPLTPTLGGRL